MPRASSSIAEELDGGSAVVVEPAPAHLASSAEHGRDASSAMLRAGNASVHELAGAEVDSQPLQEWEHEISNRKLHF